MNRLRAAPIAFCTLLISGLGLAQEATLAKLLPAETLFFLETRNPTPEEAAGMAGHACLSEPALQAVLDRMSEHSNSLTSVKMPVGPAAISSNVDLARMRGYIVYLDAKEQRKVELKDRFSVAWVGFQEGKIPVDLVFAVEVGGDSTDAIGLVRRLLAAALLAAKGEMDGDIDAEIERSIEDIEYKGVRYIKASFEGVSIFFAPLGQLVVGATSGERIRDMIDRNANGGDGSLTTDPHYKRLLSRAGTKGTATTVISVRLDRALTEMQTHLPYAAMARGVLGGVGLQGLKSLDSITWVDGRGVSSQTTLLVEGAGRGLGRLFLPGKPARLECLEYAPEESLYVTSGRLDGRALWNIGLEIGAPFLIEGAQQFERLFGVKLKEELVDLIGPEAALIVAANSGLIPDIALVLESRDAARLEASMLQMLARVPWPAGMGLQSFQSGDVTCHVAPLGHPRLAEVPIAPTFGVVDGKLVITLFPLTFQRILAVKRGEHPSIESNRDFAALRSRVPENAESIAYADLPRMTAFLYDTFTPILQAMPNQNEISSLYGLPDASLFTRHLYGRIGWSVTDSEGMHWFSHAPMDTTPLLMGGIGVVTGLATHFLRAEAETAVALEEKGVPVSVATEDTSPAKRADLIAGRDRIRRLRARFQLYKVQNDGSLPRSLDELKASYVDSDTFLSAGTEKPYVYFGPKGRGGVLVHGHANGPDGGIFILPVELGPEQRITAQELSRRLAGGASGPEGR